MTDSWFKNTTICHSVNSAYHIYTTKYMQVNRKNNYLYFVLPTGKREESSYGAGELKS